MVRKQSGRTFQGTWLLPGQRESAVVANPPPASSVELTDREIETQEACRWQESVAGSLTLRGVAGIAGHGAGFRPCVPPQEVTFGKIWYISSMCAKRWALECRSTTG